MMAKNVLRTEVAAPAGRSIKNLLRDAFNMSSLGNVEGVVHVMRKAKPLLNASHNATKWRQLKNCFVNAHLRRAKNERAKMMSVVDTLEMDGYEMDLQAFSLVISEMGRLNMSQGVKITWDRLLRSGLKLDTQVYNCLIDALIRTDSLTHADTVIATMDKLGIQPNEVTFNTLIRGMAKKGYFEKAEELILQMIERGLQPNERSYNSILNSAAQMKRLDVVQLMYNRLVDNGLEVTEYAVSAIIDTYVKKGDLDGALEVFRNLRKEHEDSINHVCWQVLLEGHARLSSLEDTLSFFSEMSKNKVQITRESYTVLLAAYVRENRMDHAADLLERMEADKVTPDETMYGIIIKAQLQNGNFALVQHYRERMAAANMLMPPLTYYHMLVAYAQRHDIEGAERTFQEMEAECGVDRASYNQMVIMYGEHQLGTRMLHMLKRMIDEDIQPSLISQQLLHQLFTSDDSKLLASKRLKEEVLAVTEGIERLHQKKLQERSMYLPTDPQRGAKSFKISPPRKQIGSR